MNEEYLPLKDMLGHLDDHLKALTKSRESLEELQEYVMKRTHLQLYLKQITTDIADCKRVEVEMVQVMTDIVNTIAREGGI